MPAPKGHEPYPGCEKGACFGYLGKGEDTYTEQELRELGQGLIEWIQKKNNIWLKYYFATKGILWGSVQNLAARSPMFKHYLDVAKEIQESKLCTEPYYRKADGNHARFMLARHHKGDWQDKVIVTQDDSSVLAEISEEIKKRHNPVVEE